MTELELLAAVVEQCGELGLLWHHCTDSRSCHGASGFPDLVIAGRRGVIFAELKSDIGETSAEQDLWLWTLARTSILYQLVWRPADLETGRIRGQLELITAR